MPDLDSMLLHASLRAVNGEGGSCSECKRTPLAGERLHELDSGLVVCELCLLALPEKDRRTVRSQRVGASERPLPVAPRAA